MMGKHNNQPPERGDEMPNILTQLAPVLVQICLAAGMADIFFIAHLLTKPDEQ
jgi:hypothetical protein